MIRPVPVLWCVCSTLEFYTLCRVLVSANDWCFPTLAGHGGLGGRVALLLCRSSYRPCSVPHRPDLRTYIHALASSCAALARLFVVPDRAMLHAFLPMIVPVIRINAFHLDSVCSPVPLARLPTAVRARADMRHCCAGARTTSPALLPSMHRPGTPSIQHACSGSSPGHAAYLPTDDYAGAPH